MIDLSLLPTTPGCYLYKNKNQIIYVGKAKNLKKRVSSYFNKKNLDSKTMALVKNIDSVDFIVTDSEVEALILENTLIKKYQPKYNIDLKDSKQFASLLITNEPFSRLILDRGNKAGKRFGPFTSSQVRDELKDLLIKTFKLRTCKRLPKKACLRYHLGLCCAPCINLISKGDYDLSIKNVELVLRGQIKGLIESLNTKMIEYSKKKQYELAQDSKLKIQSLTWFQTRQNVLRNKNYDEDIINYIVKDNQIYIMLFNVSQGLLENKQTFVLPNTINAFDDFLLRYYSDEKVPLEVILPQQIDSSIIKAINEIRNSKLKSIVPKIGSKKQLLELVRKNIELQYFAKELDILDLKNYLKLRTLPVVIECFDISHLSGTNTVASMVQFVNGSPKKSNYRKFKINDINGIDDFASIAQVVRRRYTRLLNENQSLPDLIVIDGGKGQLHSAFDELVKLNIKVPIISLAKRFEEVFVVGLSNPLNIPHNTKALKLLQRIRDEAHRFAITFNRKLRKL